jgi:hypothetical protein
VYAAVEDVEERDGEYVRLTVERLALQSGCQKTNIRHQDRERDYVLLRLPRYVLLVGCSWPYAR